MGGPGSGRTSYGGRPVVEACRRLDVRVLAREIDLHQGCKVKVEWRGGWWVQINVSDPYLQVTHPTNWYQETDETVTYAIPIEWTKQVRGGERPWFRCPGNGCERRCAVLYLPRGGRHYRCRECYGLIYESQSRVGWERLRARGDRIEARLIDGGDQWLKPPRMWWRTFNRLCDELEEVRAAEGGAWVEKVAPLVRRLEGRE